MKEITNIVSFCPRLGGNVPSLITVRAADRCFRVCFCILRVYVTLYLELLRCADTRRWRKERLCRSSLLLLGCSFEVMAPSLWKGLVGIGLFALAHAAFSAAQRKCLGDRDSSHAGLCGRRVGAPKKECRTEWPRNGHLRP